MIQRFYLITTRSRLLALITFVCFLPHAQAISEIPVDVELQLLLDVSGSVNSTEYQLQLDGYSNAFSSAELQQTIFSGDRGQIAVQLIMWSGSRDQEVMIDWTLVDTVSSATSLAQSIAALSRPFAGWTAIGSAIEYSYPLFTGNGFSGTREVIDVSGDGTNNAGIDPDIASTNALATGLDTINGIVITTDQKVIDEYTQNVVGGQNAFVLATDNFVDFEDAIADKLNSEISGTVPQNVITVSEPASLLLFLSAAPMLLIFRRKFALS